MATIIRPASPSLKAPQISTVLPFSGLLLVMLAAALWATVGVAVSMMHNRGLGADTLGFMRTLIGATVLLAAAFATGAVPRGLRVPVRPLVVFGIGAAIFQLCLFRAFREVGVTVTVTVTVCLPPVILALTDAVSARRLPCVMVVMALLAAAGGVAAILLPGSAARISPPVKAEGWALMLTASFAFAAVAASARRLSGVVPPLFGTGLGLAICAVLLAAHALIQGDLALPQLAMLGRRDLAILLYLGLFATGGAYLAFAVGIRLCRSSTSGLVASMIEPVIAAVLAAALLGEFLRPMEMIGCLAVTAAMVLIWRAETRPLRRPVGKDPGRSGLFAEV
mgnify:CR=1 FL=1